MTNTIITRSPRKAAGFIHAGEVVAFPTETVYGLGADIFNEKAIRKIFAAKGRPEDNPLIAHLANISQIVAVASAVPHEAEKLLAAFSPGPLTVVLPKHESVPTLATGGLLTIGVRVPAHALAQKFLAACGVPLVAPSANLSGRPSPTTWQAVATDLSGRISCILQGAPTAVGLESTVVDCTGRTPLILRAGAITFEQLREVVPETKLAAGDSRERQKSPGTRYKHYAPQAQVKIIEHPGDVTGGDEAAYIGLDRPGATKFKRTRVCGNTAEYAHELFAFFRQCDAVGMKTIFCQAVEPQGLGLALMDRLTRAAQTGTTA